MPKPLILAFGNRARQGKDAACAAIVEACSSTHNILRVGFADALRREVEHEIDVGHTEYRFSPDRALQSLCDAYDVPYDPFAPKDSAYPYGKQRQLLQAWGQSRRNRNPRYWINQVEARIEYMQPDVVLLSDLRYLNETEFVKEHGGYCIRVERPGYASLSAEAATHPSETDLDNYNFDALLSIPDGQLNVLREEAVELFHFYAAVHGR